MTAPPTDQSYRRNRQLNGIVKTIRKAIQGRLIELHTALPGVVVSYDPIAQEADVRVPLRRLAVDTDGTLTPLDIPVLPRVPVLFARAGGFAVTFPIAPGDEVLVVFVERDASEWLVDGADHVPGTARMHDYSDAVAIPGYVSQPNRLDPGSSTDAMELRSDDGATFVSLGLDETVRIEAPAGVSVGDGTEELVDLLSETLTVMRGLLVNHNTGGNQTIEGVSKIVIDALKVRVDSLKAP